MTTTWKPLGERVLVQLLAEESRPSKIFIPDSVKQRIKCREAIVLEVGERILLGGEHQKLEVVPGDRVLVNAFTSTDVREGDAVLALLELKDVLVVKKKEGATPPMGED